jgi:hypothetical protein
MTDHHDHYNLDPETLMLARFSTVGILGAFALAPHWSHAPFFTLGAEGAVNLVVSSDEARYGVTPMVVGDSRVLTISLGATRALGSLTLSMSGGRVPPSGRYAIRPWEAPGDGPQFEALFVAGSPDAPLGAFRGESGWVTITSTEPGRVSGEFEFAARGFVAADLDDEDRWVTVRGKFEAQPDSSLASLASVSPSVQ